MVHQDMNSAVIFRALDRWPRIHGCLEANLTGVGFPNDDQQPGSCWCNSIMGSYIDAPSICGYSEAVLMAVAFPDNGQVHTHNGALVCKLQDGNHTQFDLYFITTASVLDSYLLINTMDDLVLANETTGMNDSHYRYPMELRQAWESADTRRDRDFQEFWAGIEVGGEMAQFIETGVFTKVALEGGRRRESWRDGIGSDRF
ncbi:hypothetical protein EV421DRAFT_1729688 [Armillaria borealis]|uniref:Uncharacterized protein n=1 Tax=Armillaria borealis TaxID=47425 RepID=A0AA39N196_9AGAR|nr:hypothetical protein EV421DRAFT_1729688 [Armillaria borealis]